MINAQAGKRVILLDCDLRRPKLHELLGVSNNVGVSTALLEPDGDLPLQDTEVDNLRVMTAGPLPPNPADLLASKRMDTLLAQLTEQADLVLLDAPPVTFRNRCRSYGDESGGRAHGCQRRPHQT